MLERNVAQNVLYQSFGFRHLARAHGAAGQTAAGRINDFPAVTAQGVKIILRNRVFIHIGIHSRADQLGAAAGQHRGGQHIVGQAVCQLGADIGSSRSNQHQIGALSQRDVLHLMHKVAVKGVDDGLASGQLFKGQRRNELGGVFRHDHLYCGVQLDEGRCQRGCLIGGDPAGNTQQNGFFLQHMNTSHSQSLFGLFL